MTKPISPSELKTLPLPDEAIAVCNDLIKQNYRPNSKSAYLYEDILIGAIAEATGTNESVISANMWIKELLKQYEAEWKVCYDSDCAGDNDYYDPFLSPRPSYKFTARKAVK